MIQTLFLLFTFTQGILGETVKEGGSLPLEPTIKTPQPFLDHERLGGVELERVYYSAASFFLREVGCLKALEQHNRLLNGEACFLKLALNEDGETLYDICSQTMKHHCSDDDDIEGKIAPGVVKEAMEAPGLNSVVGLEAPGVEDVDVDIEEYTTLDAKNTM